MSGNAAEQAQNDSQPKNTAAKQALIDHLSRLMDADPNFPPPFPEEPCTEGAVLFLCIRCVEGKYEWGFLESGEVHDHGSKKPCGGCIEP